MITIFIQYLRIVQTMAWLAVKSALFWPVSTTAVVLRDANPLKCCERKSFSCCLFSSAQPSLRGQNVLRILQWKTIEVCGDFLPERFSFSFAVLKTILVRRSTETQKYKGALLEQLDSGWADSRSVEDATEQKTRQQNKKQ